jgi:transcriptional regulator with XRE-family HTH domain
MPTTIVADREQFYAKNCARRDRSRMDRPSARSTEVPLHNRIAAVMLHATRYAFRSRSRLARDCGLSKSAVSRLLRGDSSPSYVVVARVADALERALGVPIDPRELVSETGEYPTTFVCSLVGCRGCLPDQVFHPEGEKRKEFQMVQAGFWTGDIAEAAGELWQPIEEDR